MTAFKTVTLLLMIASVASARVFVSEDILDADLSDVSESCRASLISVQNGQCVRNWSQIVHNHDEDINIEKTRQDLSAALPQFCSANCGTEVETAAKNITASCTGAGEDFEVATLAQTITIDRSLACVQVSNEYCALKELDFYRSSGINDDAVEDFLESFSTTDISDYSKIQIERLPRDVVCNDCVRAYIDIGSKVAIGEQLDRARNGYYERIMSYCGNNNPSAPTNPSTGGTSGTAGVTSSSAIKSSNSVAAVGGAIAFGALVFA
ncbi:hypothetical protein BKA69DRAFT_689935 [Paraphysoderma sedebokerense]|nr:hypothetical protein BKA69DRAFT_689935 [Paraphysoderma sedebokerense]